jgi:hypothetical protein
MNTTAKQLVGHWDWAAEKGVMNRNSAAALRAACAKVLSVLDNWEDIDITGLDVEDLIRRFKNLHARDFNPTSLDAYAKRFRNALQSFLLYVEDPAAWKPTTRGPRSGRKQNGPIRDKETTGQGADEVAPKTDLPDTPAGRGLIEYPFPIRDTQVARLLLPRDITTSEVKRLYGFMLALAVDKTENA